MSSRTRRNKVSDERMKAVVRLSPAGYEEIESAIDYAQDYPDPDRKPQAVFKGKLRSLFEGIEREPLCLDRSASAERQALARIQKNNRPDFDLLNDCFGNYLESVEAGYLWSKYRDLALELDKTFNDARQQLQGLRLKEHPDKWSALAVRAAKTLRERSKSIFQHSGYSYVFDAARLVWPEAGDLTNSQISAFLACSQSHTAVESLCKLLERFDQSAIEEGFARNDDREIDELLYRIRRGGQWDSEIDYIRGRQDRAKKCIELSKSKKNDAEIQKLRAQLKPFSERKGRGEGSLRKMIRAALEERQSKGLTIKQRKYTAEHMWSEFEKNPPDGFRIIGDEIEYPDGTSNKKRFADVFNEERKKLTDFL